MTASTPAAMPHESGFDADLILAGGGLANSLIAWRLLEARPQLRLLIIERGSTLGGNHTWSFHDGDVSARALAALQPFIVQSWQRQCVRFPGHARELNTAYHAISSERLHDVLAPRLGQRLMLDADIARIEANKVVLADGRAFTAPCVLDGRGPEASPALALGFQKFLGLEIETEAPHGETMPVIMDATVAQLDGYRFVYTLPFSPTRILIEDTYYSDGPALDAPLIEQRVRTYAAAKGWRIGRVVRTEEGVLPVVLAGDMDTFWRAGDTGIPRSGLRAGLFHPTTGYSLPDAVQFAASVAELPELTSAAVRQHVETYSRQLWQQRTFFRLLNRMMFVAATPVERVRILERFYRLPDELVDRFYACRLTMVDKAHLMGTMALKPPLPVLQALGALSDARAWAFARKSHGGLQ